MSVDTILTVVRVWPVLTLIALAYFALFASTWNAVGAAITFVSWGVFTCGINWAWGPILDRIAETEASTSYDDDTASS